MSRRAPLGHSGRPRLGTAPPRPRRTPPPARCPAQAATTGLGAADPARRPASVAQASPARYGEGADSRPAGHRTTPLSHHVNADTYYDGDSLAAELPAAAEQFRQQSGQDHRPWRCEPASSPAPVACPSSWIAASTVSRPAGVIFTVGARSYGYPRPMITEVPPGSAPATAVRSLSAGRAPVPETAPPAARRSQPAGERRRPRPRR